MEEISTRWMKTSKINFVISLRRQLQLETHYLDIC